MTEQSEKMNYCIECRFATAIGFYQSAGRPGLRCEYFIKRKDGVK